MRHVPGQELVDPAEGVVGDAFEDVLEIDLWVESIEPGGAKERVDSGRAFASCI